MSRPRKYIFPLSDLECFEEIRLELRSRSILQGLKKLAYWCNSKSVDMKSLLNTATPCTEIFTVFLCSGLPFSLLKID
jgi:hypothetical protein